jgi:hypothetical protein
LTEAPTSRRSGAILFRLALLASTASHVACTHYYEGSVAELELVGGVEVVRSDESYGDCYRQSPAVPVVYAVARDSYTLRIAHGQRYWPEFFLTATARDDQVLGIIGTDIRRLNERERRGGDLSRLQFNRGVPLHDHASLHNLPKTYQGPLPRYQPGRYVLTFDVLDSQGSVIGRERLPYRVNFIDCREFDGP